MANTFKNFRGALTTSGITVYTCPANTRSIIFQLQAANVDGVNNADVTIQWTDSSDSGAVTRLANAVEVIAKTSMSVLTGKLCLEPGDAIVGIANDGDVELSGSVLEIS